MVSRSQTDIHVTIYYKETIARSSYGNTNFQDDFLSCLKFAFVYGRGCIQIKIIVHYTLTF
jgi:hypothetical protein